MKTKLVQLVWRGEASVDPRFSSFMLPWTLADIRNYDNFSRLSVGIEHGIFEAYNVDFELQFSHHLKHIVGMCRVIQKPKSKTRNFEFIVPKATSRQNSNNTDQIAEIYGPENGMVYLLKNPRDPLLHIHLYECDSVDEMTELMHQMRDTHNKTIGGSVGNIPQSIVASPRSGDTNFHRTLRNNGVHSTPASNLKFSEAMRSAQHDTTPTIGRMSSSKSYTSGLNQSSSSVGGGVTHSASSSNLALLNDISPNNSQFFEVMYVGKIKVSHKRVPHTFIDDALPKFKAYDAQKIKLQVELQRRASMNSENSGSQENISTSQKITDDLRAKTQSIHEVDETHDDESQVTNEQANSGEERPGVMRSQSHYCMPVTNGGDSDLDVISKIDMKNNNFPASSESNNQDENVDDLPPKPRDRAASIGSIPVVEQNRTMVFLIGRSDLRLISPDRKQVLLYKDFKDVASCAHGEKNADHFGIICREVQNDGYIGYVFKCQSENVANDIIAAISQAFVNCSEQKQKEKSQVLSCDHCPMIWYHKLCQDIEGMSDKKIQTAVFRRMESLPEDEQVSVMAKYNGADDMAGHTVIEQNQFLMMLLRAHCEARQQRHVHDTAENRTEFINQYLGGGTFFLKAKRSLTNSFDHLLKRKGSHAEGLPPIGDLTAERRLDIEKANSRRSGDFSNINHETPQLKSPMIDIFMKVGNNPRDHTSHTGSWRQAMLHRVVTPSKGFKEEDEYMSPMRYTQQESRKRTKDELRKLWRESAKQIIMLSRMEKENARLQARQNEHEIKRIKLEYDDISVCSKHATDIWDNYLENQSRMTQKPDTTILLQAIKNGVPKLKRGEIWTFLAEQHNRHTAPIETSNFPNYNTPYEVLLKSLTEHQHAIFIDLGRTFPNHQFYKAALGVGQLALFNLLKAYSILDPELGYCQGLGFLCGILLLHCEEAEAFNLLKHLMFKRQMRLKYLPDMKQFQLQLYQLSRLLKDTAPDLYEWLDKNDVSPTLYAAPWILTIFSSQFPLGFVARVFDLLFLDSSEVIFRIAVTLLTIHKEEILKRENFEEIMNYLKNVVPQIDVATLDLVLKVAYSMEISQKLTEYQVEYNVLQEEITSQNHHMENLNRLKETNQHLETQLDIAQTSILQLEQTRQSQQSQIQALQTQIQGLEVSVQTLGRFLSDVCESNANFDLPGDVRRVVQQVLYAEQQQQRRRPIFLDRKIGKSVSVNSHLGLALKVLAEEEITIADGAGSPNAKKKFFESPFEQMRQQKQELRLGQIGVKQMERTPNNDTDSGIATPLSPSISSASSSNKSETSESEPESLQMEQHPLSNCGDINVRFNGTTQLKSIRTVGKVVKS